MMIRNHDRNVPSDTRMTIIQQSDYNTNITSVIYNNFFFKTPITFEQEFRIPAAL